MFKKNIKRYIFIILFLIILCGIISWFVINPVNRFGYHRFAFSVYSGIPFPITDLYIYENGTFSLREKSHFISYDEFNNFIKKQKKFPDTIIIGTGYQNQVKLDEKVLSDIMYNDIEIILLKTDEAVKLYNKLKKQKKTIAAIIHSTC